MSVKSYIAIVMINHNFVSISGWVPASCNYSPAVSRNHSWSSRIGNINSWVVPIKVLSNNALCWPGKRARGHNGSSIRSDLPGPCNLGGTSNLIRFDSIWNNNYLPNCKLECLVIYESIKRKIDYWLCALQIILFGNSLNSISLLHFMGNSSNWKDFQGFAFLNSISPGYVIFP